MPRPVGEVAFSADGVSCHTSTDPLGCRRVSLGSNRFHPTSSKGGELTIFVGDDWAEDHHDIHLMDADGTTLASRRLPEGLADRRRSTEPLKDPIGTQSRWAAT